MQNVSITDPVMVVDIGNTNIVCAIYREGKTIWSVRLHSNSEKTSDEYYATLYSMMRDFPHPLETYDHSTESISSISISDIRYIALGSVVPELTRVWKHLFRKYFTAEVYEINALSPLGLQFRVKNPAFVGSDLVANAFAAWKKYSGSTIVIDLGTATTLQVVSSNGMFEGAIIAPGLKTAAISLFHKAAQISEIELISPTVLLGTNTPDAVISGLVYGHAFMLEAFINKLKKQYFDNTPLISILTGGMAELLKPLIPSANIVDKTLTLDGFHLALQMLLQS